MPLYRSLDRIEQLANVNTASLQDGSVLRYDLASARYVVASSLTATAVGVVIAGTLTVTGAAVLAGGVNFGNLVAASLILNTLTVTGTTRLVGATNAGALVADVVQLSSLTVTGATQIKGATNLGATTLPTLAANSAVVTGALQVMGATNLGATTLPTLAASSVTVTGTVQILGAATLGQLTAENLTAATLTVTGTTMLSGTVHMAGVASIGGPAQASTALTVRAAPNAAGLTVFASGGTGVNVIGLFQQDTSHNAVRLNLNNQWIIGQDLNGAGNRDLTFFDNVAGSLNSTRLTLKGDQNFTPKLALGTSSPDAYFQIFTTLTLSGEVPQHLFHGGYSTINNRQISMTQIAGASVRNYIMTGGAASGTSSAPVLVSAFGSSFGIEGTDSSLALVTAAAGNGITPIQGLAMTNTGAITLANTLYVPGAVSFGGITGSSATLSGALIARGATNLGATTLPTLAANSAIVTGAMQVMGATNLGTTVMPGLTANTLTVTGATTLAATTATQFNNSGTYGGNGTAFTLSRTALTLPDASDYTLSTTERATVILDVQNTAGASGATNLIAPGSAGGLYILLNRSTQAITLKTAGQTGIAVAATRVAIICFPGGTTGFRITPDTVYTV